jgi:hypothetical protein
VLSIIEAFEIRSVIRTDDSTMSSWRYSIRSGFKRNSPWPWVGSMLPAILARRDGRPQYQKLHKSSVGECVEGIE